MLPELPVRITSHRRSIKKTTVHGSRFYWLGNKNVIKTFTDEDLKNVDDIEEVLKLLDDTLGD
jgi:hypothetical protein